MRNKNQIIVLLALISFFFPIQNSWAQYNLYFSLKSGVSIPTGKFGGTVLNHDSFANPGIDFGAEAVWFFLPYLGVGVEGNLNNNPIDVTALTIEKFKEDLFLQDLSIRSESFKTTTITAGVYGRWNLLDAVSIQGKLLAGFMRSNTPYQLYRTEYFMAGPTYYEITSSRDDAFVIIPGLGIQYLFKRGIGFKVDCEYINRSMSFPFQTSQGLVYYERKVSYAQILLGLVIGF